LDITKSIQKSVNRKFLGLQTGDHLHWKNHTDQLVPKLNGAYYAIRSMLHISNTDTAFVKVVAVPAVAVVVTVVVEVVPAVVVILAVTMVVVAAAGAG
jgi:hypothetical protein